MIAEISKITHTAKVFLERAAVARIERVMRGNVLNAIDCAVEIVFVVYAPVEARLEIDQPTPCFIETPPVAVRRVGVIGGAV